jgi:hypothetical protein
MDDYVLEIPSLKYDKERIFEYQHKLNWQPNPLYSRSGVDTSKMNYFDVYLEDKDEVSIFTDILDQLSPEIRDIKQFKYNKLLAGGEMPFHKDIFRNVVLMFPLTDYPADIIFIDKNKNEIARHTYRCPTIINAKIRHGVPDVKKDRYFLQLNIPYTWDEVLSNYHDIFLTS